MVMMTTMTSAMPARAVVSYARGAVRARGRGGARAGRPRAGATLAGRGGRRDARTASTTGGAGEDEGMEDMSSMLEAAAAAADIGSGGGDKIVEKENMVSETIVKKKASPSTTASSSTKKPPVLAANAVNFEFDRKKVEELVKAVGDGAKDPEVVARAVAAVVAASTVATLAAEPILAAAGAASAVAVIKALELLTGEDDLNAAAFGDLLKNLNKAVKPVTDKAKDLSQQKYAQDAIERVKSVADFDRSFDEVFEGLNEKIPTMLNKPKKEAEPKPTPVVEVKAAAPPAPPKPVEAVAPKPVEVVAPKPVEAVAPKPVEKVAPKPVEAVAPKPVEAVAPKPVEKVAPPAPAPVPAMASTVEVKKPVEKVVEEPKKKAAVTTAWSNDLLKLQYSEQVIEDIRIADANALERSRARRLGLDFTPLQPKKMPETSVTFVTASASASASTPVTRSVSSGDFKAGEVVSALNSSSPPQSTTQRVRSALGISPKDDQPPAVPSKYVPAQKQEKKPSWWMVFLAAMAAFALFAFIIRAMI